MTDYKTQIQNTISENPIVVYMRGTPQQPRCGFSATVVEIFKRLDLPFTAFNADADDALWEALSKMNDWPTMPQIYIGGEFMGGCDILKEMFLSGELQQLLADKGLGSPAA
jgi:monothiol glutaredoxin